MGEGERERAERRAAQFWHRVFTLECERDTLKAELDAATCTLEDEQAAHLDTLRLYRQEGIEHDETRSRLAHMRTAQESTGEAANNIATMLSVARGERDSMEAALRRAESERDAAQRNASYFARRGAQLYGALRRIAMYARPGDTEESISKSAAHQPLGRLLAVIARDALNADAIGGYTSEANEQLNAMAQAAAPAPKPRKWLVYCNNCRRMLMELDANAVVASERHQRELCEQLAEQHTAYYDLQPDVAPHVVVIGYRYREVAP